MKKPPERDLFLFLSLVSGSTDLGSSLFQQKCEVTCEGTLSHGSWCFLCPQGRSLWYWGGKVSALPSDSAQKVDGCCGRMLRGASVEG